MSDQRPYTTLSQRIAYQTPWVTVREDTVVRPDQQSGIYSVIDIVQSVNIVAMPQPDAVYLVRLWRYPIEQWSWEVPMGRVDAGEDLLAAAQRELVEETGLQATRWQEVGSVYPYNGLSRERQHAFLALELTGEPRPVDTAEIDQVRLVPVAEIRQMIERGELQSGETICSLFFALRQVGVHL